MSVNVETGLPWDVGMVQPAVVELEGLGRFRGEVLDVGCGLGNNSVFLAERGYRVTAVDAAATAIDEARTRAGGAEVDFAVADATSLTGYDGRFDSVLDSALYHVLEEEVRPQYVRTLHRVTRPGALLSILCFTDALGGALAGLAVTVANLRTTLAGGGWTITALDQTGYTVQAAAMLAGLTTAEPLPTIDDSNLARLPVWCVQAERL